MDEKTVINAVPTTLLDKELDDLKSEVFGLAREYLKKKRELAELDGRLDELLLRLEG